MNVDWISTYWRRQSLSSKQSSGMGQRFLGIWRLMLSKYAGEMTACKVQLVNWASILFWQHIFLSDGMKWIQIFLILKENSQFCCCQVVRWRIRDLFLFGKDKFSNSLIFWKAFPYFFIFENWSKAHKTEGWRNLYKCSLWGNCFRLNWQNLFVWN